MLNQVIIVGRIVNELVLEENNEGRKYCSMTLAVPRSFKNMDGVYDTDFIKTTLFGNIAENTVEYYKVGDLVGVKGRLACLNSKNNMSLVTEKVTFLSNRKESV